MMTPLSKLRVRPSDSRAVLTGVAFLAFIPTAVLTFATSSALGSFISVVLGGFFAMSRMESRLRDDAEFELLSDGVLVLRASGFQARLARDRVEDGYEVPQGGLVLHLRDGRTLELALRDALPASEVLRQLGLTLDQRALSIPLRGVIGGFTRGFIAFFMATFVSLFVTARMPYGNLISLVFASIITWLVVRRFRPYVVVGADGVRITGVIRPRFIPYSAITGVHRVRIGRYGETGIALEGSFGARMLPTIGQSDERVGALIRRIQTGRGGYARDAARELGLLERGGRSIGEWRDAVRRITVGGFRDAALDTDELKQVLDDHRAPLERRIGAALALREVDGGRTRIRVAASTTADPRVRIALEIAGEDEIDEDELLRSIAAE